LTLAAGSRLGPYEILAPLGAGGMGEVWRARDTKLGREVALKVLPESLAGDTERLQRFEREAQLLASLNHPHIAAIYGVEDSTDTKALVLELVEGETLQERIERGAIPLEDALPIARQIAEALEAAHERGVVHRDLKPANVKLQPDGGVKVLDFGLAKALDTSMPAAASANSPTLMRPEAEPQARARAGWAGPAAGPDLANSPTLTAAGTQLGVILGTAAYMSPEQAKGRPVDKRADIWAFGALLFEMLTGARLFSGDSVVETLSAVMREPIDLERLPRSTPLRLREILRRSLEREPKQRLRDIGEARIALEELERGGALPAATPAVGARRSLGAAWGLAGLVSGLALGAVAVRWLRSAPAIEPSRVHALTFSGADSDPSASPDGKLLAFASWRDGVSRIWIKQLAGGGEAPLTEGPDRLPRFSPDGSSVLFLRTAGTAQAVYRIGLVGGEPRKLIDDVREADWSPDGRRIGFVRSPGGRAEAFELGIYDLEGGRETIATTITEGEIFTARWSPDGSTILFATGSSNRNSQTWELLRLDPRTGKVTPMPPGRPGMAYGGIAWSGDGSEFFVTQAASVMGDIAGSGSRILRVDARSGERRTVLWSDGLAALNSSVGEVSRCDVLGPGQLVFSQRLRRQNLRETALDGSGEVRLLAEGSSIDRQPTYSPDGRLILFSSNRGGNLDLWTIDRENGALRQLTDDQAQDWDPAFTPDGKQILWSSDRAGHLEIWIANADGSGARQLTQDGSDAENPTQTPDGRWVVYWSGDPAKHGIWKIHPDGSGAERLTDADAVGTDVSPDGRYVLFDDQDRARLYNTVRFVELASGKEVPFTIDVSYRLASPAIIWARARWSRDGRSIYFVGEDERGLSGVFVQEFAPGRDTSATRRPVAGFSPEYVTESLGLSPDGARLTLSTGQESSAIVVADDVPGAALPQRRPR
jgi:eukaryotic-like serine/threonine-protein kinase